MLRSKLLLDRTCIYLAYQIKLLYIYFARSDGQVQYQQDAVDCMLMMLTSTKSRVVRRCRDVTLMTYLGHGHPRRADRL